MIDSSVIRNYILLEVVKKLELPYWLKKDPYLLVMILGKLVNYRDRIINLETEPV